MDINIFTEYPEQDLGRAHAVDWPATVFIAAPSLAAFHEHQDQLHGISPALDAVYWPVLDSSYWISAFAAPAELERLQAEVEQVDQIFLDLELPLLQISLFYRRIPDLRVNQRRIQQILDTASKNDTYVYSAEYVLPRVARQVCACLGAASDQVDERIPMYYTSMIPFGLHPVVRRTLVQTVTDGGVDHVGLGTLATGALGNGSHLSPEDLDRDLSLLAAHDVSAASVFRLGGLNEQYCDVLQHYV